MAFGSQRVHFVSGDSPFLSYAFGALALVDQLPGGAEVGIELLESAADVAEHRHARHILDAAADGIAHVACRNRLGGEMDRLLAGAAHAVESDRGNLHWELGQEHGQPADIGPLFAGLYDRAGHDIVDHLGVDRAALDKTLKSEGIKPIGAGLTVSTLGSPEWRPD